VRGLGDRQRGIDEVVQNWSYNGINSLESSIYLTDICLCRSIAVLCKITKVYSEQTMAFYVKSSRRRSYRDPGGDVGKLNLGTGAPPAFCAPRPLTSEVAFSAPEGRLGRSGEGRLVLPDENMCCGGPGVAVFCASRRVCILALLNMCGSYYVVRTKCTPGGLR
jgi:hypothetical protein